MKQLKNSIGQDVVIDLEEIKRNIENTQAFLFTEAVEGMGELYALASKVKEAHALIVKVQLELMQKHIENFGK